MDRQFATVALARALILALSMTACVPEPAQTQEPRSGGKVIGAVAFTSLPGSPYSQREQDITPVTDRDNNQYVCHPTGLYKLNNTGQVQWSTKESGGVSACWVE